MWLREEVSPGEAYEVGVDSGKKLLDQWRYFMIDFISDIPKNFSSRALHSSIWRLLDIFDQNHLAKRCTSLFEPLHSGSFNVALHRNFRNECFLCKLFANLLDQQKPAMNLQLGDHELLGNMVLISTYSDQLTDPQLNFYKSRLRGALKDRAGLRPLIHELTVATLLQRNGFRVHVNDFGQEGGFDYLAVRNAEEHEVECKYITSDMTDTAPMESVVALFESMQHELVEWQSDRTECNIFVVNSPRRFSNSTLKKVPDLLRSIMAGRNHDVLSGKLLTVEMRSTPFAKSDNPTSEMLNKFIEEITGISKYSIAALASKDRSWAIFLVLTDSHELRFERAVEDRLRGASSQFSGARDAHIVIGFDDSTMMDQLDRNSGHTPLSRLLAFRSFDSGNRQRIYDLSVLPHPTAIMTSYGFKIVLGRIPTVVNADHPRQGESAMLLFSRYDDVIFDFELIA